MTLDDKIKESRKRERELYEELLKLPGADIIAQPNRSNAPDRDVLDELEYQHRVTRRLEELKSRFG